MSVLELWQLFRRRWWIIVAVALVAAVSALAYSMGQTPIYRAQAEVAVLPSRTDWELSMYLEDRMRIFRAVLTSRPLAEQALAEQGLSRSPDELLGRVHVQLDPAEGRIVIQVDDVDPTTAAGLANTLADLLQEWVDQVNDTQSGIDRIYVLTLSPAQPPAAPAGPRTKLNTLAGAVLGALLGLPLAFVWDFLDNSLDDPERASAQLGIAVWPALAPFPHDDLPPLYNPEGSVAAAFQRMHTYLRFSGAPPWRTLAVMGITPGDLPPALLGNLGAAIAQDGSSVLLVDADFAQPALHEPFDLPATPSLGKFLQRGGQGALAPTETAQPDLYLLPAGEALSPAGQATALRRLAKTLATLSQAADTLLIRVPPCLETPESLFLAAQADAVLLVGQAGRTRRRDVLHTLESLKQAQVAVLGLAPWRATP